MILVSQLGLSERETNCLLAAGIRAIERLCKMSPRLLMGVPNIGPKSVRHIEGKLQLIGLQLWDEPAVRNKSAMTISQAQSRIADLERRVKELEVRPALEVHHHYQQPLQLGQPHWPPGTILCGNGNVGAWAGQGVVGIPQ